MGFTCNGGQLIDTAYGAHGARGVHGAHRVHGDLGAHVSMVPQAPMEFMAL